MIRARHRRSLRFGWLAVGTPLLGLGCSMVQPGLHDYEALTPTRSAVAAPPMIGTLSAGHAAGSAVRTVAYRESVQSALPAVAAAHEVAIDLDGVLRMVDVQNAQIALARKRVEEAAAEEVSHYCSLQLSLSFHSSSSADDEGSTAGGHNGLLASLGSAKRIAAEAKTWQRKSELAKVRQETLLDAGTTYIDLLTARRGEAIGRELEKYQDSLHKRAENLAKNEASAVVQVEAIRAELSGRRASQSKLHQQGDGATAKLVALLNLPAETPLVPKAATLEPMDRVDVSPAPAGLVARAQASGPGVQELLGLMATIEAGLSQVRGCLAHLPSIVRRQQQAQYKLEETQLALDDARAKLAAGVVEAHAAILSGRVQIKEGSQQIQHAAETYRLGDLRLKESAPGASVNEVLQSIRGLELAHFNHLQAVSAYNKAQLRLQLLLGDAIGPAAPASSPH